MLERVGDFALSDFPYLQREDVLQALHYAAWLAEEREENLAPVLWGSASCHRNATYVEAIGPDGQTYFIRGGPSGGDENPYFAVSADLGGSPSSVNGGYGKLHVDFGDVAENDEKNDDIHGSVSERSYESFGQTVDQLQKFGSEVNSANLTYWILSQNSNSFASQAPTAVGLPRVSPPTGIYAPGSGTHLPVH